MKTPRDILLNQHRQVEPKLNRIWYDALKPRLSGNILWRELVYPCRRIWAGLACAWVFIIAVHVATTEPATRVAGKSATGSRDDMLALVEQRRMLAQMIDTPSAKNRKPNPPGPRSERTIERLDT